MTRPNLKLRKPAKSLSRPAIHPDGREGAIPKKSRERPGLARDRRGKRTSTITVTRMKKETGKSYFS
jgi:hypothetical protein